MTVCRRSAFSNSNISENAETNFGKLSEVLLYGTDININSV